MSIEGQDTPTYLRFGQYLRMSAAYPFEISVDHGEVALAWLNSHASIMLKTIGAMVVFDPVSVVLPEHVRPDAVAVTHEHLDHFDRRLLGEWQYKLGTPVLGSAYISRALHDKGTILRVGRSVSVGDIRLVAEPCHHPANEPLSYVILASDLPAMYHASDSDPFAEMTTIRDYYKPHVLLYTGASIVNATQITGLVRPKLVLSCSCDKGWERAFAQQVSSEVMGTELMFLKPLEVWRWKV